MTNILVFSIVGAPLLNFESKASDSADVALDVPCDYVDSTDCGCYALMTLFSKENSSVNIGSMNLYVVLVLPAVKRDSCEFETLLNVEKSLRQ